MSWQPLLLHQMPNTNASRATSQDGTLRSRQRPISNLNQAGGGCRAATLFAIAEAKLGQPLHSKPVHWYEKATALRRGRAATVSPRAALSGSSARASFKMDGRTRAVTRAVHQASKRLASAMHP